MNKNKNFEFGKNWQAFLNVLTSEHINEAKSSLSTFLKMESLMNKTFLDIGSGSGIHSLAAKQLGAEVTAFDYDSESVACTKELKNRFFPTDDTWKIEQGSILDKKYIESLGQFDISYSWGVLHHTGVLWQALFNASITVKEEGYLFIAIYNDQGLISSLWKIVKKTYCSGSLGKFLMTVIFYPFFFISGLLIDLFSLRNPVTRFKEHKKYRGMSLIHDWKDWLGGYPFEPANPKSIISFYDNLGFKLINYDQTKHGFGNNQFLFQKIG